jgi:bifunctional non-homologous end joining protein LigD
MPGELKTYQAKRNFGETPEPKGKQTKSKTPGGRYLIQRHAATRLHYDFRIEVDGVLKSWAVTKAPSRDTPVKRLAVEVEDHPLDYGSFEGTIPAGNYGAGTVQMWDRGTWEPQEPDLEAAFKKGQIKMVLHGERLKGKWALIRLRSDRGKPSKRNNWLLIKERDEYTVEGEGDANMEIDASIVTGRTLAEIADGSKQWKSSKPTDPQGPAQAQGDEGRRQHGEKAATPSSPSSCARSPTIRRAAPAGRMRSSSTATASRSASAAARRPCAPARASTGRTASRPTPTTPPMARRRRRRRAVRPGRRPHARLLGPAGGHLGRRHRRPDLFRLRPAVRGRRGPARPAPVAPQGPASGLSSTASRRRPRNASATSIISPPPAGRAGQRLPHGSGRRHLQTLDAPYQAGRSTTWLKSKCRGRDEVVIGGWTSEGDRFRSLIVGHAGRRREGRQRPAPSRPRRHGLQPAVDEDPAARAA